MKFAYFWSDIWIPRQKPIYFDWSECLETPMTKNDSEKKGKSLLTLQYLSRIRKFHRKVVRSHTFFPCLHISCLDTVVLLALQMSYRPDMSIYLGRIPVQFYSSGCVYTFCFSMWTCMHANTQMQRDEQQPVSHWEHQTKLVNSNIWISVWNDWKLMRHIEKAFEHCLQIYSNLTDPFQHLEKVITRGFVNSCERLGGLFYILTSFRPMPNYTRFPIVICASVWFGKYALTLCYAVGSMCGLACTCCTASWSVCSRAFGLICISTCCTASRRMCGTAPKLARFMKNSGDFKGGLGTPDAISTNVPAKTLANNRKQNKTHTKPIRKLCKCFLSL